MTARRGLLDRLHAPPALSFRILGAFMLVLALAASVTLFLENRLTRSQVANQAATVVGGQVDVLSALVRNRERDLAQALRTTREVLQLQDPGAVTDPVRLIPLMFDLKRTFGLDTVTAFSLDGLQVASLSGPSVAAPPPTALADLGAREISSLVVPTAQGRHALVLVTAFGPPGNRVFLAAGYLFDDAAALALRSQTGTADVLLVVNDAIVGSTFTNLEAGSVPPGAPHAAGNPQVVTIEDTEVFVDYATVAMADGIWGLDASVGVALGEPLAALDSTLSRNRVLMALLLVLLAFLLSLWVAQLLTRPLRQLSQTATQIARGDLDASFEQARDDEVGRLGSALEQMRQAVRSQLGVIRSQASALQAAAGRIVGAQDEERRRISHALHDGVQQQLVMLRLRMKVAEAQLADDPEALAEVTAQLRDEVDGILERVRETSHALYPAILRDRGLAAALRSMAGRTAVGVTVRVQPDPLPRLPIEVEANAYFLAAEAVANALKHAEADEITIEVAWHDDQLTISIADDGLGFDHGAVATTGGLGSMRDRVLAADGELTVTSSVGNGTRVVARFRAASVDRPLEVVEDGGDAPVEVVGVGEAELAEDGAGVLLDRPLADDEPIGDRGIALS